LVYIIVLSTGANAAGNLGMSELHMIKLIKSNNTFSFLMHVAPLPAQWSAMYAVYIPLNNQTHAGRDAVSTRFFPFPFLSCLDF
jgi:hypothetical protein